MKGLTWRRFRGYILPDPLDTDIEGDRFHGRDLSRMGLVELRFERWKVERAWNEAKRRLPPEDGRRRWLERRWNQVSGAIARELAVLPSVPTRVRQRGGDSLL